MRRQIQSRKEMGKRVETSPDRQVSLTDPGARSMATSGKRTDIQIARRGQIGSVFCAVRIVNASRVRG
jgi:hypothetical protein